MARPLKDNGLPAGIERHGNVLRTRVPKAKGERVWVSYLPDHTDPHHADELLAWKKAATAAVRAGRPWPDKPWEQPGKADPARQLRKGTTFREFAEGPFTRLWEDRDDLKRSTVDARLRQLDTLMVAFRSGEPRWVDKRLDAITARDVQTWLTAREDELAAAQLRKTRGEPKVILPSGKESRRVREWGRQAGFSLGALRSGTSQIPHAVKELYRAAHAAPGAPTGHLAPSRDQLGMWLWLVQEVFSEAVRNADILGIPYSPVTELKLRGAPARETQRAASARPPRAPATPAQLVAIARDLHPAHRLPFWIGVVMAMRLGEVWGLAVKDWDPRKRILDIHQQHGAWKWKGPDGREIVRYIKPWLKTPSSVAWLWVPPTLADLITSEIERVYGHSLDDPWWDEPVAHSPDPLIQVNRDLPICLGPGGWHPETGRDGWKTAPNTFGKEVKAVALRHGVDLDLSRDDSGKDGATSHDLRRTMSAWLHAEHIPEAARSAYLRHKHPATWDASTVTVKSYTAAIQEHLSQTIPDLIETKFIPQLEDLPAYDPAEFPTSGPDRLVTIDEARQIVSFTGSRAYFAAVARAQGLQPRKHLLSRSNRLWWRAGDLENWKTPGVPEGQLTTEQVFSLLWPTQERTPQTVNHRLRRLKNAGLIRSVGQARRGGLLYDEESVLAYRELLRSFEAGDLVSLLEAAATYGLPGDLDPTEYGVEPLRLVTGGGPGDRLQSYIRAADVPTLVERARRPVVFTRAEAGVQLGMTPDQFDALRQACPDDIANGPITARVVAYLRDNAETIRRTGWVVEEVDTQPRGVTWVRLAELANSRGIKEATAYRRARQSRWPARRYNGEIYVSRSAAAETPIPAGYVPLAEIGRRLGLTPLGESQQIHTQWRTARRKNGRIFVDPDSVVEWLDAEVEAGRLVRRAELTHRIGRSWVRQLTDDGTLRPRYTASFAGYPRTELFAAEDVERFIAAHTPPPGWVTTTDMADSLGVQVGSVYYRIERDQRTPVKALDHKVWVDPSWWEQEDRPDTTGMLRIDQVLDRLQLPATDSYRNRLGAMAREGDVPGAVKSPGGGRNTLVWFFPADLPADLRERLVPDPVAAERGRIVWQRHAEATGQGQAS